MTFINCYSEIIYQNKSANTFVVFSNSDNKKWIVPIKNTSTALNLYQPSALKGRLLKFFLPYLSKFKYSHLFLGLKLEKYSLQNDLNVLLAKVFAKSTVEFALFSGTPSKHQKITIQIFEDENILGYCKLTDSDEIKEIFRQEQKILETLYLQGVKNIPRCVYCDKVNDKLDVFIQTTAKTKKSKIVHEWTSQHWDFLVDLNKKTQVDILFEASDYYKSLQLLRKNIVYLTETEGAFVNTAIDKVLLKFKNKKHGFSVYHADFTPCNMFVENNQLFVFDFEYAKLTYPPFLDRFHYFTQVAIFKHGWGADKIFDEFNNTKHKTNKYFDNPDFYYLCYLLDTVSLFVNRDKGEYNKDVEKNISSWVKLISYLSASI